MSSFVEEKTPLLGNKSQSEQCIPMDIVTATSHSAPIDASQAPVAPKERLTSLDQFRGFVILCSLIVPLLGRLDAAPNVFKHRNTFFSLAGLYGVKIIFPRRLVASFFPIFSGFSNKASQKIHTVLTKSIPPPPLNLSHCKCCASETLYVDSSR
jgi:hypothetical protein